MNNNRDVYGEALTDFFENKEEKQPLLLHNSYAEAEEMPVDILFREADDLTELEFIALSLCDGKVLDVGAGVGGQALYLQEKNFDVTALEISTAACHIMQMRGVNKVVNGDFFDYQGEKYDTLLFLMNGIGIAETIDGFKKLLEHAKNLLTDKGQLLFDTSDLSYLYSEYGFKKPKHYFGEINYQYEYNGQKGKPFSWLYLDQKKLIQIAHELNWVVQILFEDENDQYLVRMEPRKP